ncbi:uncharacterized protein [Cherax quadricarinatus]|uniref:uncharacterized protein n=1 Tax=Cherax quadricarinatus TaxID=27406 RepID=UPI0023791414|nr:uncharacterized protein LOC128688679 [Cherax quadricarinatus]
MEGGSERCWSMGPAKSCSHPVRSWTYPTRAWASSVRVWAYLLLAGCVWAAAVAEDAPRESELKKRQIFREAVLPALGGVIPQSAFTKQRLHHNAHDQLGIEAPDGIIFITRTPQHRHDDVDPEDEREILRLIKPVDKESIDYIHTDPHGLSPKRPIPTTYLIRRPVLGPVYETSGPRFRNTPRATLNLGTPRATVSLATPTVTLNLASLQHRPIYGVPFSLPYKSLPYKSIPFKNLQRGWNW